MITRDGVGRARRRARDDGDKPERRKIMYQGALVGSRNEGQRHLHLIFTQHLSPVFYHHRSGNGAFSSGRHVLLPRCACNSQSRLAAITKIRAASSAGLTIPSIIALPPMSAVLGSHRTITDLRHSLLLEWRCCFTSSVSFPNLIRRLSRQERTRGISDGSIISSFSLIVLNVEIYG